MKNISVQLLIFLILSIFTLEGTGIPYGHEASFFLLLLSPLILYFIDFTTDKRIIFPLKFTVLSFIFFCFSFISLLLSVDKQASLEYSVFFISMWFLSIYAFSYKKEIKKVLPSLLITFGLFFSIYTFLYKLYPLYPLSQYQFVSPLTLLHNHIGDFLVLPLIISLYFLFNFKSSILKRTLFILFSIALFVLILFSYSRSAYLALLIPLFILFFQKKNKIILICLSLVGLITLVFFVSVANESKNLDGFAQINEYLINNQSLPPTKDMLDSRNDYFTQAIRSIKAYPMGIGAGNFIFSSIKFTEDSTYGVSTTSHNIIIDTFVETGVAGGILFLILLFVVLKHSRKDIYFLLFVSLLVNFQTDYTFKFYSLALLFGILAGISYEEKVDKSFSRVSFGTIFTFLLGILMLLSFILSSTTQNKTLAFMIYPINRNTFQNYIDSKSTFLINTKSPLLPIYSFLYKDSDAFNYLGKKYEQDGQLQNALPYYEKSIQLDTFRNPVPLFKIYTLKKTYEGEISAKNFSKYIIKRTASLPNTYHLTQNFKNDYNIICSLENPECTKL